MASAAPSERMLPKEVFQRTPVKAGSTAESRKVSGHSTAPGGGSARSRSTSAGSSSGSPGSVACVGGEVPPHWASAQDWKPSVVLERMLAASFVEPPPGLEGFQEARKTCLGAIIMPESKAPTEPAKSVRQRAAPPPPPAAPPVLAPWLSVGQAPPPEHVALSLPREPEPPPTSPLLVLPQPPAWSGMLQDVRIPAAVPPPPPAQPELGSEACPTVGSAGHFLGLCKPCAFFHTKGCQGGTSCVFCHLCQSGEKKRRQKARHHTVRTQAQQVRLAPR